MKLIFSYRNFSIWGLIFLWVGRGLTSLAYSAELIDKIVVVVNGEILTERQLEQERFLNQEKWEIENMIDSCLFKQEAKKEGITVSSEVVEEYLSKIKANFSETEFELILREGKLSLAEYRGWLKGMFLQQILINQKRMQISEKIKVEEEELEEFYQKLKQYLQGEREGEEEIKQFCYYEEELKDIGKIKIALIVIPDKDSILTAENIFQLSKKRVDFSILAREFSQGPNAEQGGELGPLRLKDLAPFLREVISFMRIGEIRLIKEKNLFYIIQLKDRKELLFAQYETIIEEYLRQERVEKGLQEWRKALREKAEIGII
ncbi:SurA N-terminal domain-containing protein [Candidatus Aerophobetes bacterium]|nr:SurA N-terminal domain-containing protein [Candidatus Aerophobetes bacterium]